MASDTGGSPGDGVARRRKREIVHEFFMSPGRMFMLVFTVIVVSSFSIFIRFARRDKAFSRGLTLFLETGDMNSFREARALVAARPSRKVREFLREERRLEGTAIMTLATGDAAAKHAVALVQMLRDSFTQVPRIIVLLSRGGIGSEDCHNETLRATRGRHYSCSSDYVYDDDIISKRYLDALGRLGAEVRIIDQIPNTEYTTMIPGGRASFWGMSFNKLRIFRMTEFKKILFIDADVAIYKNIDWIMHEPDFTAAFTTECCNGGARGKLGGGMWVFEPSEARWNYTMEMIKMPCPDSEMGTWIHVREVEGRGCCV